MLSLPHGRILLSIGWIIIVGIVVGSLLPHVPTVGVMRVSDKVQHFTCYFILMLWFAGLYPRNQHWILALSFVLLGGLLEIAQAVFTTQRMMDGFDLAANTAGILMAYVLAGFGLANWARRVEAWLTRAK